jgi:hypothetical protein
MLRTHPPSDRKGRLLLVAYCRTPAELLPDWSRGAVSVAERWADGLGDPAERTEAASLAQAAVVEARGRCMDVALLRDRSAAERCGDGRVDTLNEEYRRRLRAEEVARIARAAVSPDPRPWDYTSGVRLLGVRAVADLLREIFGNPFRPVTPDPSWRTDTAVSLARGMYDSRDFSPMPILADALQDAGCDRDDVLAHCRDPHLPHVRGCWVVDLVLGKS